MGYFFITLLTTAIGYFHVWTTKPIFEAKAYILAPTDGDIAAFNYGRSYDKTSLLKPFKVKDVYSVFASSLLSQTSKWALFNEVYLPSLPAEQRSEAALNSLYHGFSGIVTVKPDPSSPTKYTVIARSSSVTEAVNWVERYLDVVKQNAINNMLRIVSNQNRSLAHDLEQRMNIAREMAKEQRYDRIKQLQEALNISQAIGLEKHDPKIIYSKMVSPGPGESNLYKRGSKALKAEIENLKARQSDDAFTPELRKLEGEYNFLRKIVVTPADVTVFRLDGKIDFSDTPVAPKSRLIIAFSLVLGLVLGVSLVLARAAFTTNRADELAKK
ncbi:LPS O-antigen chain length determinant protein WzzB [Legionella tunisiensis]|uniref:LPS O-antigen chain length determinant protein WzzB n=1 Tax=Legionella tunisiensis TaxID=1034944 RepID=UPI0002EE5F7C|nr:LPS O-antigen chain length determinant protein WzzB [Legionella tunisiensis]